MSCGEPKTLNEIVEFEWPSSISVVKSNVSNFLDNEMRGTVALEVKKIIEIIMILIVLRFGPWHGGRRRSPNY